MSHRFLFTVGANLFRSLLSFVTGMLLARWFGPQLYGNMAFLLGTFIGLRQLLDMGSSAAFFTFLSQRPRQRSFVNAFLIWLVVQFIVPTIVIGVMFPGRWIAAFWHGEQRGLVLLAFAAAFMQNTAWPAAAQACEAQRRTRWVQSIGVAVAVSHLAAVALLWLLGLLGLYAVFAVIATEYLLAAGIALRRLEYAPQNTSSPSHSVWGSMLAQYSRYCLPLIPYSLVAFAYEFADRWLLQKYGGAVEQGYYAVGAQFASIALIATSSILRIFWKEIAEAHHRKDFARAGELYEKVSRLLYFVGAATAGFLIPWSKTLLLLTLGPRYSGGAMTFALMLLYPVHQSLGQITGTMLFATERVALHSGLGIAFMIASIGVTYGALAPPSASIPGLGLAAEGLALKMVAMQLLQVNVVAYLVSRFLAQRFQWHYQVGGLLGCLGLGCVSWFAGAHVSGGASVVSILASLPLYLAMISGFLYAFPDVAGQTRVGLAAHLTRVSALLSRTGAKKRE